MRYLRTVDKPMHHRVPHAVDIEAALHLSAAELGVGYLTRGDFSPPSSYALVAVDDHIGVVGFAIGHRCDYAPLCETYPAARHLLRPLQSFRLGLLKSVVVRGGHRGSGIGLRLVEDCLDGLASSGAEAMIMFAWRRGESVPAASLARRCGFRAVGEAEALWHADSLERRYICPTCGAPPCRCSAAIYVKMFGDSDSDGPATRRPL